MESVLRLRTVPFLIVSLLFLGEPFIVPATAFHSGGVGDCLGCHSMHAPAAGTEKPAGAHPASLVGSDPGSTCLSCHLKAGETRPSSHRIATADADMPAGLPPAQITPGGDFGWLKKSYRWGGDPGEAGGSSPGERHGHNIVAADYRYTADTKNFAAPGGTYPADRLSCISCHDPHGKYRRLAGGIIGTGGAPILGSGSYEVSPLPTGTAAVGVYRLLGGKGYVTSLYGGAPFSADPPAAVSPSDFNRPESDSDTRVAYGAGMSEWCANCHAALMGESAGRKVHPAGASVKFGADTASTYNAYAGSGDMSGGPATAYTSLVPFEIGTNDYSVLKSMARSDGAASTGPDANANVMCLSCHRAHASAWDHAARWNMESAFLVYGGNFPGIEDPAAPPGISQGRTRAETRRAFYERPPGRFAAYQRSLCNKCHAKD